MVRVLVPFGRMWMSCHLASGCAWFTGTVAGEVTGRCGAALTSQKSDKAAGVVEELASDVV